MNIYLIRHARQNSTLCNVNVELSEAGKEQAKIVGKRLKHYSIDAIYSSDLIRAVETANIINNELGVEHVIREGIRESDFGDLEGIENDEVKIVYKDFFDKRDKTLEDIAYPGGESGEQVYERAYAVLKEIVSKSYENVVVVTHGGTIRALLTGLLGMDYGKKLLFGKTLENCSITHLLYNEQKDRFYVERFNDFAHLEERPDLLRMNFK